MPQQRIKFFISYPLVLFSRTEQTTLHSYFVFVAFVSSVRWHSPCHTDILEHVYPIAVLFFFFYPALYEIFYEMPCSSLLVYFTSLPYAIQSLQNLCAMRRAVCSPYKLSNKCLETLLLSFIFCFTDSPARRFIQPPHIYFVHIAPPSVFHKYEHSR